MSPSPYLETRRGGGQRRDGLDSSGRKQVTSRVSSTTVPHRENPSLTTTYVVELVPCDRTLRPGAYIQGEFAQPTGKGIAKKLGVESVSPACRGVLPQLENYTQAVYSSKLRPGQSIT